MAVKPPKPRKGTKGTHLKETRSVMVVVVGLWRDRRDAQGGQSEFPQSSGADPVTNSYKNPKTAEPARTHSCYPHQYPKWSAPPTFPQPRCALILLWIQRE